MGKKILFVDDDETWCKRVGASFAMAGYDIVTAMDASKAMDLAEKAKPRCVVLDINLDGENGVILLKFLRRNHPKLPIVIFTGVEHDDAAVRDILKLGADQYLTKRSVEELIVAVSSYV